MKYDVSKDRKTVYVYSDSNIIKCVGIYFNLALLFTQDYESNKYKFAGITTKRSVKNYLCTD